MVDKRRKEKGEWRGGFLFLSHLPSLSSSLFCYPFVSFFIFQLPLLSLSFVFLSLNSCVSFSTPLLKPSHFSLFLSCSSFVPPSSSLPLPPSSVPPSVSLSPTASPFVAGDKGRSRWEIWTVGGQACLRGRVSTARCWNKGRRARCGGGALVFFTLVVLGAIKNKGYGIKEGRGDMLNEE